jgi:hypothetical protein
LFPYKVREDLVEMAMDKNAESDPLFQSHITESPLQSHKAETPRFNKILGRISTILSILGFVGSAVIYTKLCLPTSFVDIWADSSLHIPSGGGMRYRK